MTSRRGDYLDRELDICAKKSGPSVRSEKCAGPGLTGTISTSCARPVPTSHLGWKAMRPRTQSNESRVHEKTALGMPTRDRYSFCTGQ